jgi:hypothetical protein
VEARNKNQHVARFTCDVLWISCGALR